MKNKTSCIRCVVKECSNCFNKTFIRYGYTKGGKQRIRCTTCGKTKVEKYTYKAYNENINQSIIKFTIEGVGIRGIARILQISTNTLLKRLLQIAENIKLPKIPVGKVYEVDELCTFVKNKKNKIWIVYALERSSGHIVSFAVGKRTNKTLKKVIDTLHLSRAKRIFTDRLRQYKTIIDESIHKINRYGTNHIERYNLSLRTHIKRLNRRSICYARSTRILKAILKIYFYKWNLI